MKRMLPQLFSIFIVSLIIISFISVATAGTIGNPTATLKQGSFQVGAEVDFTKRDMEEKSDEPTKDEVKSNRYVLKGTYGISDQINIYAKLGMADADFDVEDEDVGKLKFKGDLEFVYGAGLKASFYNQNNLKLGMCLQAGHYNTEDSLAEGLNLELDVWEYDVVLGASYNIMENLAVYGGALYSVVDGDIEIKYASLSAKTDIEEDDSFGLLIGGDFNVMPQFSIGVEARLINETSFSLILNYAFF